MIKIFFGLLPNHQTKHPAASSCHNCCNKRISRRCWQLSFHTYVLIFLLSHLPSYLHCSVFYKKDLRFVNEGQISQKTAMRKSQEKSEMKDKRAIQTEEEVSDRVRKSRRMWDGKGMCQKIKRFWNISILMKLELSETGLSVQQITWSKYSLLIQTN